MEGIRRISTVVGGFTIAGILVLVGLVGYPMVEDQVRHGGARTRWASRQP